MRIVLVFIGLLSAGTTLSQVWEKPIIPGLTYRMELDHGVPRVIHAFKLQPKSSVSLVAELARGSVYTSDSLKGRETLTGGLERTGAIAGINADFFPLTGDPLGLMVRNGDLLSEPYPNRSVFAWGKSAALGIATFSGTVKAGVAALPIDGVNRECAPGQLIVFTPRSGLAISRLPNVWVIARVDAGAPGPNASIKATIDSLMSETDQLIVPEGCIAVVAAGSRAHELAGSRPGDSIRLQWTTAGVDWTRYENAIGGGPFLVRGGKIFVDAARQGFTPAFSGRRHPRTAIGVTTKSEVWLVTVDGRQTLSGGATLDEMAKIMLDLGCVEAMNLDGGGSTAAGLHSHLLNKPSEGSERAVSNMLLLVANQPSSGDTEELAINGPMSVAPGDKVRLTVTDSKQIDVPNAGVVWWAVGPASIDQGGLLRVAGEGTITIGAVLRGRTVRTSFHSSRMNSAREN